MGKGGAGLSLDHGEGARVARIGGYAKEMGVSAGGDDMGACCGVEWDRGKGNSAFRTRSANGRPRYKAMEGTTEGRSSKVEAKPVSVGQDLKPEETSSVSLIETVESVTEKARETPVEVDFAFVESAINEEATSFSEPSANSVVAVVESTPSSSRLTAAMLSSLLLKEPIST